MKSIADFHACGIEVRCKKIALVFCKVSAVMWGLFFLTLFSPNKAY